MSLVIEKTHFPLTSHLVARGAFRAEPVVIADVGASGGLSKLWDAFGDQWRGFGFEPLLKECERLNRLGAAHLRYVPAFVSSRDAEAGGRPDRDGVWFRSSAVRTTTLRKINYVRDVFNAGEAVVYARDTITLDEFFPSRGGTPAFVKMDTDGHDFDVLRGGRELLDQTGVLGVLVECPFHGDPANPRANVFANSDTFLRARGFQLFDLTAWRYSRGHLPAPFAYDFPAQTVQGQVIWGDALYFREFGHPQYESMTGRTPEPRDVLRLACLFELFSFNDCAVEVLLKYRDRLGPDLDVGPLLDLLTPAVDGRSMTYQEYDAFYRADPGRFFPGSGVTVGEPETAEGMQAHLRARAARLEAEVARLHARVARLERRPLRLVRKFLGKVRRTLVPG